MEKDSLQATLKETDANCRGLKAKKDTMNIEHGKFYKHMEDTFLKQQKEVEELKTG